MSPFDYLRKVFFNSRPHLCRIKYGIASGMSLYADGYPSIRQELGLFEIGVSGFLRKFSKGAQVGYDIGSYWGYYALAMARQGIKYIYAFDTLPRRALEIAVEENNLSGRVNIMVCRLGREDNANTRTMDSLYAAGQIRLPDLVKMDVDGEELGVLQGSAKVISLAHPAYIIEVHSRQLEKDCMAFLKSFGYKVRIVDNPILMRIFLAEMRFGFNRWIVASYED
jgi:predicted RNA methylase